MWPHCDQYHTSYHTPLEQENKVKSITHNSDTKQDNKSFELYKVYYR